jgi:D-hydroxyproline dehydrogenase subunit alpha
MNEGYFCGIGVCFACADANGERTCLALNGEKGGEGAFDIAVVGAGPAGLAAASAAARLGRRVVLLDAGPRPGGQYWRHRAGEAHPSHRYVSQVDYRPSSAVWFLEPGFTLHTLSGEVHAGRLILAAGAYDRAIPFPGWDLPGVVTAGGAQALLKGRGVAIGRRIVVAGTGPFLLPVAAGLADAGAKVCGVYEAAGLFLPPPGKILESAGYLARLLRHGVRYHPRRVVVAAHGTDRVTAVTVARPDGAAERVIDCDTLAVGYGFTPQVELALAAGCDTAIDDGSLVVTVDSGQCTSVPGVYAAGELTGVGGAELAFVEGTIAGLTAAGVLPPQRLLRKRERLRRFAARLKAAFPVPSRWLTCPDETVLCRCEGVVVGAVREAARDLGVVDGRGVKLMTRAGMGICQGRVCGYAASCLVAQANSRTITPADLAAFAHRPIAQPVPLGRLAS